MQTDSRPLLKAKHKPKTTCRSVKLPSKRFVSVHGGFPSRWLLWIAIGSSPPPPQTEENRHRTHDRRLGRIKHQLKLKFFFVFQRSFPDKLSFSCTFFRNEQRASSSFCVVLCYFCIPKIISLTYISITDVADLQNVQLLSLGTTHWFDLAIDSCNTLQNSTLFPLASHCTNPKVSGP